MKTATLLIAVFILAASAVVVGFCFLLRLTALDENVWQPAGAEYEIV
jgi:hypothetical protein